MLSPFGNNSKDIEVFARLQRGQNLNECLQAMNDAHWRFGMIYGESGAGKTSFLQAGLWPALEALKNRCVYVKFSDLDPFQSVKQACVTQLSLSKDSADGLGLLNFIRKVAQQNSSPLVLIFDQFEQFFVHCKQEKDRKPFVQALTDWYNREQYLPVKILISIRGDFLYRLGELHEAMKYSLSPAQSFRLKRFEPPQATEIFCAIAEEENIYCDRAFISELTKQELANREDGSISPIDIQVLSWMVAAQTNEENRAFDRTTFQKLGGVEGLLDRYLERALDVRETSLRQEAAIKVLVALTDLERNTRAGALTIKALREKLKEALSEAELKEAVTWLSRSDVRLIAPLIGNQEEKFELAHERLIPAIRKHANKTLEPVARVNQLLESRVNEWIGNGRNSRYLFSPSELRLISKQKSFITWGESRNNKDDLIAASKKRLKIRFAVACLTILIFTGGWFIWSLNSVQIYLIKRDLRNYGLSLNGDASLGEIAKAFYVSGEFQFASQILDRIDNDTLKTYALSSLADTSIKLGDKDRALSLLNDSLKSAERIVSNYHKARLLSSLANITAKLGDKDRALLLLMDSLRNAEKISDDASKSFVLSSIADIIAKLGDKDRAPSLLNDSLMIAEKINDDFSKAIALSSIADAVAKLGDIVRALSLLNDSLKIAGKISDDYSKARALSSIAGAIAKLGDKDRALSLLNGSLKSAEKIKKNSSKAFALSSIVDIIAKLGDKDRALSLLNDSLMTAEKINDDLYKAIALSSIAGAIASLGDKNRALSLLNDSRRSAELIDDDYSKAQSLSSIAGIIVKLGDKDRALLMLNDSLEIAEKINDDFPKAESLSSIAKAFAQLGEDTKNVSVIKKAFAIVEKISDDSNRYAILKTITESRMVFVDIRGLRSLASYFSSETSRAKALARILTIYARPELVEKENPSEDEANEDER
jgi:tetratricopeptide (TPR) repeat protein